MQVQLSKDQLNDLSVVTQQLLELTSKPDTRENRNKSAKLTSVISALKAGASLKELDQQELNERERAMGIRPTRILRVTSLDEKQKIEARMFQALVKNGTEFRANETEGNLLNGLGTYNTSGGTFVPTEWMNKLYMAMGAHDALFDGDFVTLVKSTNGRPIQIPTAGDIENVASVTTESSSLTTANIYAPKQVVLGAYSYQTPMWFASLEVMDDLEASFGATLLFSKFSADRLARGIGDDLLNGDGSGTTLGLIPTLEQLGITPTIANGTSESTGGSQTGANSIGVTDLRTVMTSLNEAYHNENCAWLMNRFTLGSLASIIDKYGNIVDLVKYDADGTPRIFGFPVRLSPNVPSVSASNISVLFGDFSYWITRLISDEDDFGTGIKVFKESPGLVEQGLYGVKTFCRAHGVLAFTDTSSPCPIQYLQQHS